VAGLYGNITAHEAVWRVLLILSLTILLSIYKIIVDNIRGYIVRSFSAFKRQIAASTQFQMQKPIFQDEIIAIEGRLLDGAKK